MAAKHIKLSSLSEGLRKEVKKHLKEGKTKLSRIPDSIRRRVMEETYGDDTLSQSDANDEWSRKHDYDMEQFQSWKEIYDALSTGDENIYDGDIESDMKSVLYGLTKRGVIQIEKTSPYKQRVFLASPMSYEQFIDLVKGHIVDDDFLKTKIDDNEILTAKEYEKCNDDLKAYYLRWKLKTRSGVFSTVERRDAIDFGVIPVQDELMPQDEFRNSRDDNEKVMAIVYKLKRGIPLTAAEYFESLRIKVKRRIPLNSKEQSEAMKQGLIRGTNNESKQIKLSSLSEGLRREVKKHLKEGRTKLGQMPPKLANEILSEMNDMGSQFDSSGNPILPWGSNGSSK